MQRRWSRSALLRLSWLEFERRWMRRKRARSRADLVNGLDLSSDGLVGGDSGRRGGRPRAEDSLGEGRLMRSR